MNTKLGLNEMDAPPAKTTASKKQVGMSGKLQQMEHANHESEQEQYNRSPSDGRELGHQVFMMQALDQLANHKPSATGGWLMRTVAGLVG